MIAIGRRADKRRGFRFSNVTWKTQLAWLGVLLVAQLGDVGTTAFGLSHGTVEGNSVVAGTLDTGGLTLFWILKMLVAAAMILAVVLVRRFARFYPNRRGTLMHQLAFRGTQLGALALVLVSVNNVVVAGLLPIWPRF